MRFYDLDIDVKNYAKRIIDGGNPIPSDIEAVSDFVKGLKAYNIYYSLIDAWFLRKAQNAGQGTTVYGFKKYNGIIVNGGIWQSDGIECDVAFSRYIDVRLQPNTVNTICAFSVGRSFAPMPNFTNGYPHHLALSSTSYVNGQYAIYSNGNNGNSWTIADSATLNMTSTYTRMLRGLFQTGRHSININSGATATVTSPAPQTPLFYDRIIFGGRWFNANTIQASGGSFGVGFHGTHTAEFLFDSEIDNVIFYNLFKSTVGRGLVLP
jgi:hypothetical protein